MGTSDIGGSEKNLKMQKQELEGDSKEDRFLLMLMNHVLGAISQIKKEK